jgi:hypothetical protein
MANRYVFVRIKRDDFNKIMKEKKLPMEQDLQAITGKIIKLKNTQIFSIAANSTWDLGEEFQGILLKGIKLKKIKGI